MKIDLDINPLTFCSELRKRVRDPHESMSDCIEHLLQDNLLLKLQPLIASSEILGVKTNKYRRTKWQSFKEIISSDGYHSNYLRLHIDTPKGIEIEEEDIVMPKHLKWIPVEYGGGWKRYFKFKGKKQKTKNKYEIEIFNICVPSKIMKKIYSQNSRNCKCEYELLSPIISGVWNWWVRFGCKICGKKYFCSCFKKALDKFKIKAEQQSKNYAEHGWPHRFLSDLRSSEYRPNICHICTNTPSNMFYCHSMYGSTVKVRYGPYIKKTSIEQNVTERDAENMIREKIGFPKIGERWINETHLYHLIRAMFPQHQVIREASPQWLEQKRLDIYLPELKLAIEYQGEQHFKPIDLFGGMEGFVRTQYRDDVKKSLCKKNGIHLVYFKHDENLTEKLVELKLKKYLKNQ